MTFKLAKQFKGFSINSQMVYWNFQESLSIPLLSDQTTKIITKISLCFFQDRPWTSQVKESK